MNRYVALRGPLELSKKFDFPSSLDYFYVIMHLKAFCMDRISSYAEM